MKGTRTIQHHPGQENKTGKATYASTMGTNSSTVQSPVADYNATTPEADVTRHLRSANKKTKRPFPKISKQ